MITAKGKLPGITRYVKRTRQNEELTAGERFPSGNVSKNREEIG
jgi:hypothetical protein